MVLSATENMVENKSLGMCLCVGACVLTLARVCDLQRMHKATKLNSPRKGRGLRELQPARSGSRGSPRLAQEPGPAARGTDSGR